MGSLADFYVGRGKKAEWLGSIAYDGYPDGNPEPILTADNEASYRQRVMAVIAGTDSGTFPEQGWPWPYDDSVLTDYAYAFEDGKVWISCFGCAWYDDPQLEQEDDVEELDVNRAIKAVFPNMCHRKNNPSIGSIRSGIMLIGGKKKSE